MKYSITDLRIDAKDRLPYTRRVPRLLAALVAGSIVILQVETGAFHTHEPVDGPVPEHHHGPAIHHHEIYETHDEAIESPHLESVESSPRVITVAVPVSTMVVHGVVFMASDTEVAPPMMVSVSLAPAVATRSHDPPAPALHPLRGPPHILTA